MQFNPHLPPATCSSYPQFLDALERLTFADRRRDISREPVAEFLENNKEILIEHQHDPQLQVDLRALAQRVQSVSDTIAPFLLPEPSEPDFHAMMGVSPYPTRDWQSFSLPQKVAYINENEIPIANLVDYKTADAAVQFLVQNPDICFLDIRGYEVTDQQLTLILQNRPQLSTLYCDSSLITGSGIDFSRCPQLQNLSLRCSRLSVLPSLHHCPIHALDLSTSSLKQIDMSQLNQLEGVESTNCPNLVKVILPKGSFLKVLNVGGCAALLELENLSSLTGLIYLGLHNCVLMKTLDLSQLTTLQALHVGGIQFDVFTGLDKLVHLDELNREGSNLDLQAMRLQMPRTTIY